MLLFTAKRVLSGILLLVAVSIGTFFLAHLAISDPTASLSCSVPNQTRRFVDYRKSRRTRRY